MRNNWTCFTNTCENESFRRFSFIHFYVCLRGHRRFKLIPQMTPSCQRKQEVFGISCLKRRPGTDLKKKMFTLSSIENGGRKLQRKSAPEMFRWSHLFQRFDKSAQSGGLPERRLKLWWFCMHTIVTRAQKTRYREKLRNQSNIFITKILQGNEWIKKMHTLFKINCLAIFVHKPNQTVTYKHLFVQNFGFNIKMHLRSQYFHRQQTWRSIYDNKITSKKRKT